jgi:hypothetical protein
MTPKKIADSMHGPIARWIVKTLKKENIRYEVTEPWKEETDMEIWLSKNIRIQVGNGYYSVTSSNDGHVPLKDTAWVFVDGAGHLVKEINEAIAAFPDIDIDSISEAD